MQSMQMVELGTMFTRLLISVDKTILLLGILPSQIQKQVYLGEN